MVPYCGERGRQKESEIHLSQVWKNGLLSSKITLKISSLQFKRKSIWSVSFGELLEMEETLKWFLVLYMVQKLLVQVFPVLRPYLGVLFILWLEFSVFRCLNTSEKRNNLHLFFTTQD